MDLKRLFGDQDDEPASDVPQEVPAAAVAAPNTTQAGGHCADVAAAILAGEWIESVAADGRLGLDCPGVPIESRWWERFSFEQLPELP